MSVPPLEIFPTIRNHPSNINNPYLSLAIILYFPAFMALFTAFLWMLAVFFDVRLVCCGGAA